MKKDEIYHSLGLMTGTSCDGIDVAYMHTDGHNNIQNIAFHSVDFPHGLRKRLIALGKAAAQQGESILEQKQTKDIIHAYSHALSDAILTCFPDLPFDIIAIHGQTILHKPHEGITIQICDADIIAQRTEKKIITDFRTSDIKAGGQGAPLAPLYHQALLRQYAADSPACWVNIGGVANVTYFNPCTNHLMGWDTGMGNGLIDNLCQRFFGEPFDKNGEYAARGQINHALLDDLCDHRYFKLPPPKSLDRNDFTIDPFLKLEPLDAIATVTAFTARTIMLSQEFYPSPPEYYILSGGGVHNQTLIELLSHYAPCPVHISEHIGSHSGAIEAECFAWLGVRALKGLPLSSPSVTGARYETSGGKITTLCA